MMTGVNIDPLNPLATPDPRAIRDAGLTWVRIVSRPGVEQYVADCQAVGLMVLAVVARESEGHVFGGPDVWQFGNEPDQTGPSSWTMAPDLYAAQFVFYRQTYPQLTWIGAGLASGRTTWWSSLVSQVSPAALGMDGFAVHPYNKTAAQAKTLLASYQKITPTLPLWVTEWWRPERDVPGFAAMLRTNAVNDAWFCWSSQMVDGFGLTPSATRMLAA